MYYGVDYYPEQWPAHLVDEDLSRIVESGLNCVRLGDFIWHKIEPRDGEFDFSFFYSVLDKCLALGIKVMMCTPTATVTAWLYKKHQSIFSLDQWQNVRAFGGRRQACLNSRAYNFYAERVTSKIAGEFSQHPAIIVWHIDNELGHETSDVCYCGECEKEFRKYLATCFKNNIDDFNDAIGSIFWSQTYNSFDEIDLPHPTIPAPNPGMVFYFKKFRASTTTNFLNRQVSIVKSHTSKPILHNFTGDYFSKAQDHADLAEQLDVVALNNYPVWGERKVPVEPHKIAMKLDQTRGLIKGRNFWITEQLVGGQAHDFMGYVPRPGHLKIWSLQAMGHGCDNLLYFRWRTATKGAEQFCYGVLDHDNEYGHRHTEMVETVSLIKDHQDVFHSDIKSDVALLYSMDNIYSWQIQPQSKSIDIQHEHARLYKPFFEHNISIDVIDIRYDFTGYKVILIPIPFFITDKNIQRIKEFVSNGGIAIISFRSGIKEEHNSVRFNKPNPIQELAKIKVDYFEPLPEGMDANAVYKGRVIKTQVWRDMIRCSKGVESLCSYQDEFSNYAVATKTLREKGMIYYVGAGIDDAQFWSDIVGQVCKFTSMKFYISPSGVEVIERTADKKSIVIILNHNSYDVDYLSMQISRYSSVILDAENFHQLYEKHHDSFR